MKKSEILRITCVLAVIEGAGCGSTNGGLAEAGPGDDEFADVGPLLGPPADGGLGDSDGNVRDEGFSDGGLTDGAPGESGPPDSHPGEGGFGDGGLGACTGAKNTPGGPDPWGGCWPGAGNTGPSAGAKLVNVDTGDVNPPNSALPPDNTGWAYSVADGYIRVDAANAVIDGISDTGGIYVAAGYSLTMKNSQTGLINNEGTSLLVQNCTMNGGSQGTFSTVSGDNVTVESSNLFGGEHEVNCQGDNCKVENSWLHDNYNGAAQGDHQNGFLSTGGSNFTISHNSVGCVGGCTADIAFLDQGGNSDATVSNNLLLASPDAAFCVYPGPDAADAADPVSDMVWTNNVFQRGANAKCATYGPVYGWYPGDGTGNVWSGNMWDDGAPLTE